MQKSSGANTVAKCCAHITVFQFLFVHLLWVCEQLKSRSLAVCIDASAKHRCLAVWEDEKSGDAYGNSACCSADRTS
jgi:hypothetical protein